ncbi:hypothetical protein RJ639_031472, partial [Escallonia herrerae]
MPSHPSSIISVVSSSVANLPAAKCTTDSLPSCLVYITKSSVQLSSWRRDRGLAFGLMSFTRYVTPNELTSVGLGASKANVKPPLPRVPGRSRLSRRDSFKKMRDKFSGPITPRRAGNTSLDTLSHVGYTELKITSDSESEVPFSDDDDGTNVAREEIDPKAEFIGRCGSVDMAKARSDNESPVKQTHQASDSGPSLLDQSVQLDVTSLASDPFGEHNWEQPNAKPSPYALPELISLDDVHQSSNVAEVPFGVSAEKSYNESPSSHNLYVLSELMPLNEIPPQISAVEFIGANDAGNTSITKPVQFSESSGTTTGTRVSIDVANDTDQTGASKLVSSNEGRQFSGMLAERLSVSDSAKVVEDLKFLSPILSTHEMGSSSHASPRAHDYHDRVHRSDASSSDEVRVFQRSASLERNDLGYESPGGSSVSEIEGESAVDRLKRQVEYDRRCMSTLYRELEEERSASAIAANQAMAMITRLQEEKAALHMEALQYLRMMEEQAEYDMDALQKANDLLAEKEKEVQDLEAELELQRNNFTDESAADNLREENCNLKDDNMALESSATVSCESTRKYEGSGNPMDAKNSLLHFEDEKLYISEYLKNLERKLHTFSSNLSSSDMPNGFHLEKLTSGIEHKEEHSDHRRTTHINHQKAKKNLSESNGSSAQKESITSAEDNHVVCKDGAYLGTDKLKSSIHNNKFDLAALENEISDLNERLQAFEADRDFLENAIKTLQNGNEGLQYIQEIATQLQELRKDE